MWQKFHSCLILYIRICIYIFVLQHFLGTYNFKSKTLQDEFSPEGLCKAYMFALYVKEELDTWPEQSLRRRSWLTIPEATECCRHPWMREALKEGFSKWHADGMISAMPPSSPTWPPLIFSLGTVSRLLRCLLLLLPFFFLRW